MLPLSTILRQNSKLHHNTPDGTYRHDGEAARHVDGYYVSLKELGLASSDFQAIEQWLKWSIPYAQARQLYIGVWTNIKGERYWDITMHAPTLEQALTIGKDNYQQAIWDIARGESVYLEGI